MSRPVPVGPTAPSLRLSIDRSSTRSGSGFRKSHEAKKVLASGQRSHVRQLRSVSKAAFNRRKNQYRGMRSE